MVRPPKLEVLDALRGFCALIVVVLHFSENCGPGLRSTLLPHGCLPVEYFLILTGFTLSYAYDGRWGSMSVLSFFRRRLLRMHPLVVVGSLIGACCYLVSPEIYASQVPNGRMGLGLLAFVTLWCCTMIPVPKAAGWILMHPLQGPLWTMFYIYLANVLYAVVLRHLRTAVLIALALLSAVFTAYVGVSCGGFHSGPVWVWKWAPDGNVGALARMCFPVLAGMVIARKGWRIPTGSAGLWICIAVLGGIFFAPEFRPDRILNGIFESAAVLVCMPLVLLCGVGGTIPWPRLAGVCRFLGAYSFPLYATHYPMTMLHRAWLAAHPGASAPMNLAVCCAFAFFAFINAWAAMRATEAFANWTRGGK